MKQIVLIILLFIANPLFAQPAWQQRVDTKIEVLLDDKKHVLHAVEDLTYTNNSPDTLRYIYIHLWPNAYKNDHTPYERQQDQNRSKTFYHSKPASKGYIDSLQFTVDGVAADHYSSENAPDVTRIDLPKALLPGKTITISTPFKVKLPRVFSRLGHTGQAYYISQWFPKPAVYDQKGWHPMSYMDQGEFYSEYGSYDVSITLPANYVVMATGNCTDEKENNWLDELAGKTLPVADKKTVRHNDTFPPSAAEMKTIHFHEDNVHDFAWFADKRWWVRKDTVYSPGNNLLVTTWAAFMPSYQKQWEKATDYLKQTVRHYGKWVGPYQYKTIKAVLGDLRAGGGMEYPTVTVIDRSASAQLEKVVVHEAGHNWFYGMLGSNERDHAWLDEGVNTFYEQKTTDALDTATRKKKKKMSDETTVLFQRAATHIDQAIDQTSANFEKLNYGLDVYFKTAMALRWLEQYMGAADFEAGMHDYYDKWHFHHPYPEDFKECMQRHTSKSIDWFFETMLTTDEKVDFTIVNARIKGDSTEVTVKNNTGLHVPVQISSYKNDSLVSSEWVPWPDTLSYVFLDINGVSTKVYSGMKAYMYAKHPAKQPTLDVNKTKVTLLGTNWNKLKIADVIPDAKSTNDVYRRHAIFHHFGVKVKPFIGWNNGDKDRLFISPAVAYNQYDGIMAGLLLHDLTLPENRFRFALAPLYSFATESVVGCGSIGYMFYSNGLFKEILVQADAKTFHNNELTPAPPAEKHLYTGYTKIAPSLNFTFNEHNPLSTVTRTLTLKGYAITEDYFDDAILSMSPVVTTKVTRQKQNTYGALTYTHRNDRTYNPFRFAIDAHMSPDFAKVSATGNLKIDYNRSNKALYIRAYVGKFFTINNTTEVINRYQLNASYGPANDYLYDGTYIARSATNDKPAAHQVSIQEGGFKIPVYNGAGRSSNWMATINLLSDLPIKRLPIRLFFDAGLIPNAAPTFKRSSSTTLIYEGGVEIKIIPEVVSVYFPLIMSSDFENHLTNTYGRKNVFSRSISFTMQLQNINWLRAPAKGLKMLIN